MAEKVFWRCNCNHKYLHSNYTQQCHKCFRSWDAGRFLPTQEQILTEYEVKMDAEISQSVESLLRDITCFVKEANESRLIGLIELIVELDAFAILQVEKDSISRAIRGLHPMDVVCLYEKIFGRMGRSSRCEVVKEWYRDPQSHV